MIETRRLIIHGRVQGVGYRYGMMAAAKQTYINGWVRNRRDGTVEAVVQGTESAIEQITDWARQGPMGAAVSRVEIFEVTEKQIYVDFVQHPTQ